jgi:hypothetical protein
MADYEALLAAEKGKKPEVRPPVDKPQIIIKPSQMEKTGKEEINDEVNIDVVTSSRQEVNYRAWRDLIEDTETHNSSLRITRHEKFDIEDFIKDLERKHGVNTSLNELARLGMLYLIDDYKKKRTNSLVYKVKKS